MVTVFVDMSGLLNGHVAGPNCSRENPIGDDGEKIHGWVFGLKSWREQQGMEGGDGTRDSEIVAESIERVGAAIMGRRMFDNGEGPWGEDLFEGHWGENPPFHCPVFVVTHHKRDPLEIEGSTTFYFVTDGIVEALKRAKEAAGDRDVENVGGADVVSQYVRAGLVDDIQLHVSPC